MLIEYIKSILFAKTPNRKWLRILIAIGIIMLIVMFFQKNEKEGFEQKDNFVLKK